jgi:hypothetical protein
VAVRRHVDQIRIRRTGAREKPNDGDKNDGYRYQARIKTLSQESPLSLDMTASATTFPWPEANVKQHKHLVVGP